ncbi:MAG TPA: 5-oxoprolinase subunit PxpB [Candidatus Limnocylindrales bacterium]|nr:5-oxoprolinase subunit PxpB [Candidatus Limnocylindrales bacterium]
MPELGSPVTVQPFGDAAVLITLADEASVGMAARAQALARRIRAAVAGRAGWGGVVPAATSVLVHVDPEVPGIGSALPLLESLASVREAGDDEWPPDAPTLEVPVRYGGDDGPDLLAVAEAAGLTPAQVVEAHASTTYRALFLGFAPGFAYLGPLPSELVLPRRATPRVRVAHGSVAIAGPYTAVYPIDSPGGWHLLGRSDLVWDPTADPATRLDAGWLVRFVPNGH